MNFGGDDGGAPEVRQGGANCSISNRDEDKARNMDADHDQGVGHCTFDRSQAAWPLS
jgi:hypothetical protein